jgi:hypothetical protein
MLSLTRATCESGLGNGLYLLQIDAADLVTEVLDHRTLELLVELLDKVIDMERIVTDERPLTCGYAVSRL